MDKNQIHDVAKRFVNQQTIHVHEMLYLIGQAMEYETVKQELKTLREQCDLCTKVANRRELNHPTGPELTPYGVVSILEDKLDKAVEDNKRLQADFNNVLENAEALAEDIVTLTEADRLDEDYVKFLGNLRILTSLGEFQLKELGPILYKMKKDVESIDPEELRAAIAEAKADDVPF